MKEIVIKIDDEEFEHIKHGWIPCGAWRKRLLDAIKNGKVLPKGHGRLIDADNLWNAYHDLDYDFYEAFDITETIIEADKEE